MGWKTRAGTASRLDPSAAGGRARGERPPRHRRGEPVAQDVQEVAGRHEVREPAPPDRPVGRRPAGHERLPRRRSRGPRRRGPKPSRSWRLAATVRSTTAGRLGRVPAGAAGSAGGASPSGTAHWPTPRANSKARSGVTRAAGTSGQGPPRRRAGHAQQAADLALPPVAGPRRGGRLGSGHRRGPDLQPAAVHLPHGRLRRRHAFRPGALDAQRPAAPGVDRRRPPGGPFGADPPTRAPWVSVFGAPFAAAKCSTPPGNRHLSGQFLAIAPPSGRIGPPKPCDCTDRRAQGEISERSSCKSPRNGRTYCRTGTRTSRRKTFDLFRVCGRGY
jgi:hypothetical protein